MSQIELERLSNTVERTIVNFDNFLWSKAKANAYYNILDTDYENYAVIFSCNNYYGSVNKLRLS